MTTEAAHDLLQLAQLLVFVGLGLAAFTRWYRDRTAPAGWIAAAFVTFGAVVLAARLLPEQATATTETWEVKFLLVVLILFPYFLYRFMVSLLGRVTWSWTIAHVLTGAVIIWSLLLPELPGPGEPRTPLFTAYVYLLLTQWGYLTVRTVLRLWSAGTKEPPIARRRMRLLSSGALAILLALIVSGTNPRGSEREVGTPQLVTGGIVLLSAPLMLIGFAPPRWILAVWRQREEAALREAETALIRATTVRDVADLLLPALTRYLGVRAATLHDSSGALIGAEGVSEHEADRLFADTAAGEVNSDGRVAVESIAFQRGRLTVVRSLLAPFFGAEERRILEGVAGLTDLAMARAELFERESRNSEAMRDFIAIASHDLRTPITVIGGIGSLLTSRWHQMADEDRLELASKVEKHAKHIGRIVEDLLTVSKMDARALELEIEPVDLCPAVEEVVQEFTGHDAQIVLEIPSETIVAADPDHLKRILRNYLANAFVYGAPPVTVSATERDRWVELRVSDQGGGIPDDFLPRLFEKFARAQRKMSKATAGTGLGLSIVRGLAREMGGDAFYEPAVPCGATFGIRLPRSEPTADRSQRG